MEVLFNCRVTQKYAKQISVLNIYKYSQCFPFLQLLVILFLAVGNLFRPRLCFSPAGILARGYYLAN